MQHFLLVIFVAIYPGILALELGFLQFKTQLSWLELSRFHYTLKKLENLGMAGFGGEKPIKLVGWSEWRAVEKKEI